MPTRNTCTLDQIVEVLGDHAPPNAVGRLENHFKNSLLIVAGSTQIVAGHLFPFMALLATGIAASEKCKSTDPFLPDRIPFSGPRLLALDAKNRSSPAFLLPLPMFRIKSPIAVAQKPSIKERLCRKSLRFLI